MVRRGMVAKWLLLLMVEAMAEIWAMAEAEAYQGQGGSHHHHHHPIFRYTIFPNVVVSPAPAAPAPLTTAKRSVPCRDQNRALTLALDCVAAGSLQTRPTKRCCSGMNRLVSELSLSCMCQLLISVAGSSTPSLLRTYVTTCSIRVPPGFSCKVA